MEDQSLHSLSVIDPHSLTLDVAPHSLAVVSPRSLAVVDPHSPSAAVSSPRLMSSQSLPPSLFEELLKQYEMVKLGKMPSTCTGNFTSTMGLPCSHKMISLKDGTLPLSSIHSQWRIDISSLTSNFGEITNEEGEFEGLLNEVQDKYFQWPLVRKENAREKISQLIGASLPYLEPNVEAHKGRPSKKQKQSLSTKRDPSKFEIVEANRRCSTCKGVGHNSRTCQGTGLHELNPYHVASLDDGAGSTMGDAIWEDMR